MKHTGELIIKYHGEEYTSHETRMPIHLEFEPELKLKFEFAFPESNTIETVEFDQHGNENSEARMQPYGIEIIIPDNNSFYINFMLVEESIDNTGGEMFTGVAKFNIPFVGDDQEYSVYRF
jgi:hypothetical protein